VANLTDDELEEIADNLIDKEWRLRNLYHIKNKAGKKQLFNMNPTQLQLHASKSRFNATLKGRQQGVTTYYDIKYLDDVLYNENMTVAILADKRENIEKVFRPIKYAYKYIPEELKPEVGKGGGSKYEMYFPSNESRIYVALEVRSESVQRLHVSEYAFMKNRDKYNASVEAVPLDSGEISIESTPMGMNHFYEDWIDKDWHFKKHFFPWFFHYENTLPVEPHEEIIPNEEEKIFIKKALEQSKIKITKGQLKWRRIKIKTKGRDSFLVEHPEDPVSCFMTSGTNPLDVSKIRDKILELKDPIKQVGPVTIYEEFNKNEIYVCGADTAGGTGGDYYYGTIFRVSDWVQCAQIRGNRWKPSEFASYLVEMCKVYQVGHSWPLLGVERNNHGHAVLLALSEIEHYPNLFYHEGYDDKLGWNTTSLTRPTLLDHFIEAVDYDVLKIRSKELLGECLTLVDNEKGKVEAQEGKHDDSVMGTAIAVQLLQMARKLERWNSLDDLIGVE